MELKKVGECLQEKFGNVADAVTGKAARKKKMNCVKRDLCLACYGGAMFCLGCWAGIHRNVIKALVLREKMPKAPHWHVWCH